MPPKAAAAKEGKVFSADVVAAVLYSTGTTSLSMKHYEMMSALDGTKTASGFQHDFRAVIAKSKELKARVEGVEEFTPVPPANKRGKSCFRNQRVFAHTDIPTGEVTPKATPKTPKTPSKRKAASSEDDLEATPSKKKATPKAGRAKKPVPVDNRHLGDDSMDEGFPEDASEFIKGETKWEDGFA
jgi:hypothetical protein